MRIRWIAATCLCLALVSGCGAKETPESYPPGRQQLIEPELSVYLHKTGQTQSMMLEKYLEGVIAGEMQNDWDLNALAAQAIIARTFTLEAYESGQLTSQGTNASTDIQEFQAYNADAINENIKKAVEMTRGKIATYKGMPIKGWFFSSAGGKTAMAKEGLDYPKDEPPFIHSVDSPDELAPDDQQAWTADFSMAEVLKALRQLDEDEDSIKSVKIGTKGPSGRATTIVFNGDDEVSAPKLRLALGSTKLKSMLLDSVNLVDGRVIFKGRGYGHGVGMSQYGALKMARDGKSPEEIIQHYYKDVKIEKRW